MNTSDDTTRPTTPPNKRPPISQNAFTPVSHHSTQDLEYLTGVTDLMRDAVKKDVDYIAIEVKREEFSDYVLPPLKQGIDIEQIVKTLEAEGLIIAEKRSFSNAKSARIWKDFSKSPSYQKLNEEKVLAPLEAICSRVTKLASAQLNGCPLTVTLVRSCSIDFVSSEVIKHAFQYLRSDTTWRPRSKMKAKKPEENANTVHNVDEELDEESAALADSEREKAIHGKQAYGDAIGWMNDTFYELAGILNQLRVLLTTRYRDFEASFPCVDWGRLQGTHKEIQQIFEQCREYAFDIKTELLPYKSTDLWNLTSPSNDEDDADKQSEEEHKASRNEEKTAEDLLQELILNEDGESDGDDEDEDNRPPFSVHMVK
ncbi:hypothetical protein ACEPAH_3070 [Sanghuangporus vaninii]